MRRFSVGGLLGFVGLLAVGLAALVNATAVWVGVVFTLTVGILLAGVLGWILRGRSGGAWVGLVVFGWGFFLLGQMPGLEAHARLPSFAAAHWIYSKANAFPVQPPGFGGVPGSVPMTTEAAQYFNDVEDYNRLAANAPTIGHWLFILIFAQGGAVLGGLIDRGRRPGPEVPPAAPANSP